VSFWRQALAITRKDIISEVRSREIIFSVLVFALLAVVIFNFAFGSDPQTLSRVAPGIMWVTFAFSGVLSLNRAFIIERESGCMEALLVSPASRESIYVGKGLGSLVFMLLVEIIVLAAFAVLFNLPIISVPVLVTMLLTTIGFVAVGTLFAAMAVNTKARELVLPILFLPIISPLVLSAVKVTDQAITGGTWGDMASSLEIIAAFDVVFVTIAYLIFGFVIEE
jgi:heme exporter protein B